MSLPVRLPALVSDCAFESMSTTWLVFTPIGVGNMKKYSLHLIFTFYLDRDTPVPEVFPVLASLKKTKNSMGSVLTHLLAIEIVSKIVGLG